MSVGIQAGHYTRWAVAALLAWAWYPASWAHSCEPPSSWDGDADRPPHTQAAEGTAWEIPVPGDLEAMEADVARAIRSDIEQARSRPADANAVARLGMLYNANFLTGLSVPCYRRAVELDPRNPQWHYLLALASADMGDAATAERELRTVLELAPDYPAALFHLGEVYLDTGRADQAGRLFEKLKTVAPDSAGGYYGLGRVEYRRKGYERARRLWEAALRKTPDSRRVRHQLGLVYRRLGRLNSDPQLQARAREIIERRRRRRWCQPGQRRMAR